MVPLRFVKAGLLSIIAIVMGAILVFVLGGPMRRVESVSVSVLPQQADSGMKEFTFVQSKGGLVDWKIKAKQAEVFESEAKAVLSDVQVTLAGRDGISMTVEGDDGTINTNSNDFVVRKRSGDLALVLKSGYTIYTSQINWANQEQRLWTDEPVTIKGPRLEVTGQGMDAFLATREMRIRSDVRVGIH
jgi:lipopolysaccharide export system protein LptC